MDGDAIFGWLELLDTLDYYELLAIERDATADDVKRAFHDFATTFHPDGHPGRDDAERGALDAIFRRGNEAYMVLSDPNARERYDAQLASRASGAPRRITSIAPAQAAASHRLEDKARTPTARPFARRAEELAHAGDLKQAKLQMVMALHHDPQNDELADYLARLEHRIKAER